MCVCVEETEVCSPCWDVQRCSTLCWHLAQSSGSNPDTQQERVCVFEENRECVSGVTVWCVCQHVVSVSTLEMHMFICVEVSSFFISFMLMCFLHVHELKSLLFFSVDQRCQKLVTLWKQSSLVSLQLSWGPCGDMKDTVQGSYCISPLLFCLPFLFLTGSLPVWTDSCLSSIRCRSAWRSCTCGPSGTACKSQVIKTPQKSLFHTFGCLLYVYSLHMCIIFPLSSSFLLIKYTRTPLYYLCLV